jgi:hypothetical protein
MFSCIPLMPYSPWTASATAEMLAMPAQREDLARLRIPSFSPSLSGMRRRSQSRRQCTVRGGTDNQVTTGTWQGFLPHPNWGTGGRKGCIYG